MRLASLLCAVHVTRDADTDAVSLFHVLDVFESEMFPVSLPGLGVYALLEREKGEEGSAACRIRVSLDGSELAESAFTVDFLGRSRTRVVRSFPPVYLMEPGVLRVEFHAGGKRILHRDIEARLAGAARD
jgi:hypothetical protein